MKDVHFEVAQEYVLPVLVAAGYVEWTTIHKGKEKKGYIRELAFEKRFHIYYVDGVIALHLDKTIDGKHKAVNWPTMMNVERRRLKKIYKSLLPVPGPSKRALKRLARKNSNVFAPNLVELQRNIKQPPRTLLQRIVRAFK